MTSKMLQTGIIIAQYVGFLLVSISAVRGSFDCHRQNQNCQNGGTCISGFVNCSCPETHEGFDCALRTEEKDSGNCTMNTPCTPDHGVCYFDGEGEKCYCDSDHYGDSCSVSRLSVSCTEGHMVIGINPYNVGEFSGLAYIEGKSSIPKCRASDIASLETRNSRIPSSWEGLFIDVAHSDIDCGVVNPTESESRMEYVRFVVIQYSSHFISSLDEKYQITCYLNNAGLNISDVIPRINASGVSLKTIELEEEVTPIVMYILVNGDVIDGNSVVYIGADLVFYFNMAKEYTSMRIVSGEADNRQTDEYKRLTLIENSCIHEDATSIIDKAPYFDLNDTHLMIMNLRAFQFVDSSQVSFRFHIKVCVEANNDDCDPVDCPSGEGTGFGRKRRSEQEKRTLVERTLHIATPPVVTKGKDNRMFIKVLITLLALGVLLTSIGIITATFIYRDNRFRRRSIMIIAHEGRE